MEVDQIINGDCLDVMKQIPDGSVDLVSWLFKLIWEDK